MVQLISSEKVFHLLATQWDMHDVIFTRSYAICDDLIFKWWNLRKSAHQFKCRDMLKSAFILIAY